MRFYYLTYSLKKKHHKITLIIKYNNSYCIIYTFITCLCYADSSSDQVSTSGGNPSPFIAPEEISALTAASLKSPFVFDTFGTELRLFPVSSVIFVPLKRLTEQCVLQSRLAG